MSIDYNTLVDRARGGDDVDAALTRWAADYAARARAEGLTPEGMLVVLKREVAEAIPVESARSARESRHLLERAVTRCIEAYFADRSAPARPSLRPSPDARPTT